MPDQATRLNVCSLDLLGRRALGSRWQAFDSALAAHLSAVSHPEDAAGRLWRSYLFTDAATAFSAWHSALGSAKSQAGWASTLGPAPFQALLSRGGGEPGKDIQPSVWLTMPPEHLYVTTGLLEDWKLESPHPGLPAHTEHHDFTGAWRLAPAGRSAPPLPNLLPARSLPVAGSGPPCFHCGMRSHPSRDCPSHRFAADAVGLALLGAQALEEVERGYRETFSETGAVLVPLPGTVSGAAVAENPPLQSLAAFFDLTRVFQLRFLSCLEAAGNTSWGGVLEFANVSTKGEGPVTQAIEALARGALQEAHRLAEEARGQDPHTRFFQECVYAFIALYLGDPAKTRVHLLAAAKSAKVESHRVYFHLLLSRLCEVQDDLEGALQALQTALSAQRACPVARLHWERLACRLGKTEGVTKRLHALALEDRSHVIELLIDPWLAPVRPRLDRVLLSLFLGALQGGLGRLLSARVATNTLGELLGRDAPSVEPLFSTLRSLEETTAGESYFGLLEATGAAGKLLVRCGELQQAQTKRLRKDLSGARSRWQAFEARWRAFPVKTMYKSFDATLGRARDLLDETESLLDEGQVDKLRLARSRLEEANRQLVELKTAVDEMGAVGMAFLFTRRLALYLLIAEAFALSLAFVGLPLLRTLLRLGSGGGTLAAGGTHRPIILVLTLLAAPTTALVLALWKQQKLAPKT